MIVKFKLTHPNARIPTRGTAGSAGFDVYACERVVLHGGKSATIPTGLTIELPPGRLVLTPDGCVDAEQLFVEELVECQLRGRSSLAFKHNVVTHQGTIDPDYRGEIGVKLFNFGASHYVVEAGDRVAQLVFSTVLIPRVVLLGEDETLSDTERGTGGYGSTGR